MVARAPINHKKEWTIGDLRVVWNVWHDQTLTDAQKFETFRNMGRSYNAIAPIISNVRVAYRNLDDRSYHNNMSRFNRWQLEYIMNMRDTTQAPKPEPVPAPVVEVQDVPQGTDGVIDTAARAINRTIIEVQHQFNKDSADMLLLIATHLESLIQEQHATRDSIDSLTQIIIDAQLPGLSPNGAVYPNRFEVAAAGRKGKR